MSEEAMRLVARYGSALAQDAGSRVYMTGGAESSEAHEALLAYIQRIERERDEARATLNRERPQWRGLIQYFHCCCQIDPDNGETVSSCAFHAEERATRDARIAALEAENAALRAAHKGER